MDNFLTSLAGYPIFCDDGDMSEENTTPQTDSSSPAAAAPGDDRTMAMLSHLLAIFFYWLAPLIIWLVKKDSPFVADQAKESLNFQITVLLAMIVAALTCLIGVGFILVPAISVANLILCIMATIAANKGERYRYPFAIRLIK